MRFFFAIALALSALSGFASDPAIPASTAAEYPATASAPGAPVAPAVQKGVAQADAITAAAKPWYSDVGSISVVAGVAALGVIEKYAPAIIARLLPAAGPYGGLIAMVLGLLQSLVKPAAVKAKEQLVTDHAQAFQVISSTIQNTSNAATIADLKDRLSAAMSPQIAGIVKAFVDELEAKGIDHDVPGSATPAAPAKAA